MVKIPKNYDDIRFLLTLRYPKWDKMQRFWVIPNYPGNMAQLQAYFKDRDYELIVHENPKTTTPTKSPVISKNEVLCIKTRQGRLKIMFTKGYKERQTSCNIGHDLFCRTTKRGSCESQNQRNRFYPDAD